jgi:hypothetical protein
MRLAGDRMTTIRTAVAALAFLLVAGPPVHAHIAGGGPATTDCYVEFEDVDPTTSVRVDCLDGDPSCDHDGECGTGCTFRVPLRRRGRGRESASSR